MTSQIMLCAMASHNVSPLNDWLVPAWPVPAHVHALCTTRGATPHAGTRDGFNLGLHVGDDPARVQGNRAGLRQALGARPVFLRQVHGTEVRWLDAQTPDEATADGALTRLAGVACTVMVADCLPVLLCDRQGTQVAALHAGWRGLLGDAGTGILEQCFKQMTAKALEKAGLGATDLIAWLGPCIGPDAFEVGPEVRSAYLQAMPASAGFFRPGGPKKWLADLPGLARQRLQNLGITEIFGNDGSPPWCTVGNPSRFFSHRRDGVSGRFAAAIWLNRSGL